MRNRTERPSAAYVINCALLCLFGLATLYPFWYVVMMSFSTNAMTQNLTFLVWPKGFTLNNILYISTYESFAQTYANTAFVVVAGTILSLTFTVFFAYPLAKKVPGTGTFSYMAFFTMLFSGGMIPTYLVVKAAGLVNALWSLILPVVVNPFYCFLMINFFKAIPDSLSESADIDGAGVLRTIWQIVLPVSLPGLSTLALFYAVAYWNSYFDAMIYISDRGKWTLQLLLREILISTQAGNQGMSDVTSAARMGRTLKMATIFVSIVPIMMIYPFVQRYFIQGVMVGAIKG